MKCLLASISQSVIIALFASSVVCAADDGAPSPITADQAFDAVTMQVDPDTGNPAYVVLVDVRDPGEYLSSGAAAAVEKIHFLRRGKTVEPKWGKVRLLDNGKFIEYRIPNDHKRYGRSRYDHTTYQRVRVDEIESIETTPLAYNVKLWGQTENGWDWSSEAVDAFYETLKRLLESEQPDAVILYCRTGGRSSLAGQLVLNGYYNFQGVEYIPEDPMNYGGRVYEIDDPEGENGYGGFTGPDYGNVFNGYAGFPGRLTDGRLVPSVSWKDAGLPVKRAVNPLPAPAE